MFSRTDRCIAQRLGAVAGHEAMPARSRRPGWAKLTARAVDLDACRRPAGSTPESAANSSSWPWPSSATTPATSPLREVEGDVLQLGADLQVAHGEARSCLRRAACLSGRAACATRALFDLGAEHQFDDPLLDAGADVDDADRLAVAQHGGAVAERGDLDEAVRDEDDRAAGLALPPDDVEHALGEVGRQRRGHLVEQQHVGLDGQRAGEIEHALDGERHVARGVAQVEVGDAEFAHPVAERLDRRLRSGGDWTATSRSGISDGSW